MFAFCFHFYVIQNRKLIFVDFWTRASNNLCFIHSTQILKIMYFFLHEIIVKFALNIPSFPAESSPH